MYRIEQQHVGFMNFPDGMTVTRVFQEFGNAFQFFEMQANFGQHKI